MIARVCAKSYLKILLFTFKLRLFIIVQIARYSNVTSRLYKYGEENKLLILIILAPIRLKNRRI